MVFTLLADVAEIAFHNKAIVYDLLFKTASETMTTIAADPQHLGTRIGITAVLHTWGSGYTWLALVEADISRFKRIIGEGLRSRTDRRRATEVSIAVDALNRMLELGRPDYVRIV